MAKITALFTAFVGSSSIATAQPERADPQGIMARQTFSAVGLWVRDAVTCRTTDPQEQLSFTNDGQFWGSAINGGNGGDYSIRRGRLTRTWREISQARGEPATAAMERAAQVRSETVQLVVISPRQIIIGGDRWNLCATDPLAVLSQ